MSNMGFFSEEVQEAAKNMGGKFIKAAEFEGDGITLQCVRVEKIKSNNTKFGANAKDALYKQEILAEGEVFQYVFNTPEGEERHLESKSMAAFIAFNAAELEPGDWVQISKTGKLDDTRYSVKKVEQPVSPGKQDYKAKAYGPDAPNPEGVPF